MQQVRAGVQEHSIDGRTPEAQIDECHDVVRGIKAEQALLRESLIAELAENGIRIIGHDELSEAQRAEVREELDVKGESAAGRLVRVDPGEGYVGRSRARSRSKGS